MSDPNSITPLSGEIMSGSPGPRNGHGPQGDVVDAEFTTIARAAAGQAGAGHVSEAAKTQPVAGLDILAKSSAAQARQRSGVGFWACGLLAAAASFWMAGGHSLARNIATAWGDGDSRVQVASVRSQVLRSAQGAHLVIDGKLENRAATAAKAPDIDIEVAAVGGGVTRYRLGNGGALIEPRGERNFSSRLTAPEKGVRSVSVTVAGGG